MKKIVWLLLTLVMVASLLIGAFGCAKSAPAPTPAPAPAPAPVAEPAIIKPTVLTLWASWGGRCWMSDNPFADWLVERVNDQGKAVNLSLRFVGGTEVFPNLEGLRALGQGLVDVAFTTPAYHPGEVVELNSMVLSQLAPWEERESGAYDMLNNWYQRANAFYWFKVGSGWTGNYRFYLNPTRTKPDLSGLKIRGGTFYDHLIKALGGIHVAVTPGEIYSAMERGVVDGYSWSSAGLRDMGYNEVTKYLWGPLFYNSGTVVIMNNDVWNKLHEDQKTVLLEIGKQMERDMYDLWVEDQEKETKLLAAMGVQEQRFTPEEEAWYLQLAQDTGWEAQIKRAPESEAFRAVSTRK